MAAFAGLDLKPARDVTLLEKHMAVTTDDGEGDATELEAIIDDSPVVRRTIPM